MKSQSHAEVMAKIFEISENSYFRWKKKDHRVLVNLIEKYFKKEDLEKFLLLGNINKFEINESIEFEVDSINNKFFIEYYSRKIKNTYFSEFIFPQFQKYIHNHKIKIKSQNIKDELIQYIIELSDDTVKNYLKSHNNMGSVSSFKSSTIREFSELHNLELYMLFNTYEQYMLDHSAIFNNIY